MCHGLNALQIVDSLGCVLDTSIYIGYFGCNWDIDFTVGDTALSCYGDLTSIGISINGGTGPITIICDSDTICEITQLPTLYVLTNVQGGDHHIIVQDTLCCRVDTIIHIGLAPDQISMNITTQNNTCYDQCSGSFDAEVTGGVAPYQFFWTLNGIIQSNTEDIDSLCAGVYTLGILDNNSCFAVYDSLTIDEICCSEIVINLDSTYYSCPGVAEAGAFITVAGGAEPYSFEWIGPTTSSMEDPINMIPGDYTLVVVDANGCSDSLEVVIPSTPMAEDPNNAGFVIPVGTSDWDITTWGITDVYFDEDITVPDSAILNITGLNLFFTPGHGINVLPNGLLNAENCKFDVACGLYWDGFRVEGFTQPDSIVQRGVLELETCSLTHALVAAASHRITLPAGTNPEINVVPASTDVTTQGGYIKANGCTFIDNKRDIDIRKTANQKSHIQESLFGECMFRISSLPVIPSLAEPNVRIFLAGVTNVFFESCNLDNNNPAYLGINTVFENNLFIGLQANNSTFFWEGENARVLHFRTGIRISGRYMGIAGDDIERTTQIRGTIFNNLISVMATNELDVFIAQNSFTNLDGVVWTYPGYSINSNARSYGIFLNGLSSTGSQFDIIENQFAFNSIPNIDYNQATGILVKDSRGIRSNLIYGNSLWGCQRYAMNFVGKNRSAGSDPLLGLHYECNTFGNVNNSALWNRYDVYVEFTNLGGYGVAPIQRNTYGLQPNGSAGNNFQSSVLPSSFLCDDVEYTTTPNSMYTQFYRLFPSSEVSGGGELCDVVVFDPTFTQQNFCVDYDYSVIETNSFTSLSQNLTEYLDLRMEYDQLIDDGNTESLKAQVQMSTVNSSFSIYQELMSISPDLSQEVLLEAIAKENEIPSELLVEVLSNNPLSSKKEVVLEALFNRDNPLSEGEFNQIINAVVYESTRKQMEVDLSNLEAEYHIAQNRQIQNFEIESPSFTHELFDLFKEDLFKEDLLMKSVFMRGLGDWSGSIALLQSLPDKHILSEQDKVVILNEVELLSLESEIVNQQLGHISEDQISLLMNWHMDHHDITCARASELLFIYAGINDVPYCLEDDNELKKFNHSNPNKFTSSFRISPNIVRDYCTIHLEELRGYICSIKVTDMTGKELKSLVTKPDQNQIILNLSDLSSGLYHLTLVCESKNFTDVQKIIKE